MLYSFQGCHIVARAGFCNENPVILTVAGLGMLVISAHLLDSDSWAEYKTKTELWSKTELLARIASFQPMLPQEYSGINWTWASAINGT